MKKFILILLCAVILIGGLIFITRNIEETDDNIQPTGSTRDPKEEAALRAILESAVLDAITPPTTLHPREERAIEEYEINKSGLKRLNLVAGNLDLGGEVPVFYEDVIIFRRRGKAGLMSIYGEEILPPTYNAINIFSEGLAAAQNERSAWGYIDKSGKVAVSFVTDPAVYDWAGDFSEGLAMICNYKKKIGFIDTSGKVVIPFEYDWASDFKGGYAVVSQDNKYGIINRDGEFTVPLEYAQIRFRYSNENLFSVGTHEGSIGMIDAHNNIIVPFGVYDVIHDFFGGLAGVKSGNKWGYINIRGEILIPVIYDDFSYRSFENSDFTFVQQGGKWAVINKSGEILTDFVFSNVTGFREGLAGVYMGNTRGYIDESGEFVITGEYQAMDYFLKSGVAAVAIVGTDGTKNPHMMGLIDRSGRLVLPCVYAAMSYIADDVIAVQRYANGTWDIYEIEETRN